MFLVLVDGIEQLNGLLYVFVGLGIDFGVEFPVRVGGSVHLLMVGFHQVEIEGRVHKSADFFLSRFGLDWHFQI